MKKREEFILTAGPSITKKEISYVTDAVTNGWNDQWNKYITKLETQFSDYIGVKHAISTTSCTGAMHLALKGLGIGRCRARCGDAKPLFKSNFNSDVWGMGVW